MDYKQFYIELGRLLYAIAKSDGTVQDEEMKEFYQIVKKELLPLEDSTDEFGTDRAFYTEFEFEAMLDRGASVNEAYLSFVKFLKANSKDVNDQVKQICLNAVYKIAEAYAGIERSEQFFIDRLKDELDKL